MKLNRAKNTKRNMVFGLLNVIINMFFPFIIRTVIIHLIGKEYLGLDSLFSSILHVLNLAELGFSTAVVYSMYKPIAEDDNEKLNTILNFYRKVYFIIGVVILAAGLLVLPFLRNLIKGEIPSGVNLYVLYLIYLSNTVMSYLFLSYRGSLLNAYQRYDVISKISIITSILAQTSRLIVLVVWKNYYLYAIVLVCSTILNNILTYRESRRLFPDLEPRGILDQAIRNDIKVKLKGLMISKVCEVSRNALDSIFISGFIGLVETAIYNNYYTIMAAVIGLLGVLANSVIGGVGNSIAMESKDKNYDDMTKMNFWYMWLAGWCTTCLFCLYQPFTAMFFGKDMVFPTYIMALFCLYFYLLKMGDIRSVYFDAAGLWWESRYKSIAEAVCNLVLNYVLGKYFGVVGILMATIISIFFINFLWGSNIIFHHYFTNTTSKEYYLLHLFYALITCMVIALTSWVCNHWIIMGGIVELALRLLVCILIPNLVYWLVYRWTPVYRKSFPWLRSSIRSH